MSLAGEGAVAIWHDIAPEGREAFYAWHGVEHMPERVGIPGFLRGRRYVAIKADLEFFNLYEAQSPQVVAGSDYLTRLNNPTPWTVATVKHFRKVSRAICRVAATFGRGQGGLAMTWRYDVPDARAAEHERALAERVLPALNGQQGIAGAHLLIANAEASGVETAERKARGEATQVPRWIVLVEGWGDEAPFAATCAAALSDGVLAGLGANGPAAVGLYRLQTTRTKTAWAAG
jgi:hypothetical protein